MFHGTRCQAWGVVRASAQFLTSAIPVLGTIQVIRTRVDRDVSLPSANLPVIRSCRRYGPEPG